MLVSIDTLRADRLALYGGDVATPNLDKLAARGVRFERAYSHAPITGPSHSALFTSMLPSEHGVHNNGQRLAAETTTLAELLQASGRKTAAFVSLAALSHSYGYDAGFDTYVDERTNRYWWMNGEELNEEALPWLGAHAGTPFFAFVHYSDPHEPYLPPADYQRIEVERAGKPFAELSADGRRLYIRGELQPGTTALTLTLHGAVPMRTRNWKQDEGVQVEFGAGFELRPHPGRAVKPDDHILVPGRPATITVHDGRRLAGAAGASGTPGAAGAAGAKARTGGMAVSIRFDGLPQHTPEQRRAGYDAETRFADRALGALIQALDRAALWDSTAVVVTADHGEELGEQDMRFGHIHRLTETLIHVPLVIVAPGFFEAGSSVPGVVRHIDLLPTLAQVMGFQAPKGARGASLWPVASIGERVAIAQTYRPQAREDRRVAVSKRFRLLQVGAKRRATLHAHPRSSGGPAHFRTRPSAEAQPAAAAAWKRLHAALGAADRQSRAANAGMPTGAPAPQLTPQQTEALRALGYLE